MTSMLELRRFWCHILKEALLRFRTYSSVYLRTSMLQGYQFIRSPGHECPNDDYAHASASASVCESSHKAMSCGRRKHSTLDFKRFQTINAAKRHFSKSDRSFVSCGRHGILGVQTVLFLRCNFQTPSFAKGRVLGYRVQSLNFQPFQTLQTKTKNVIAFLFRGAGVRSGHALFLKLYL